MDDVKKFPSNYDIFLNMKNRVQTDPGKPGKPGKMVFFEKSQGNPGEKNKNFAQLREFYFKFYSLDRNLLVYLIKSL